MILKSKENKWCEEVDKKNREAIRTEIRNDTARQPISALDDVYLGLDQNRKPQNKSEWNEPKEILKEKDAREK